MNELRIFSEFKDKKTADAMTMKVVQRLPGGQYECSRITDEFKVIASKANPNDEFIPGTWVTVNYLGASRLTLGGQYIIVSRAPYEQRGISGNPVRRDSDGRRSVTVSGFDPDPLVLRRGGTSDIIVIYGSGFLTAPDLPSGISNATPPVITPTRVTLDLQASGIAPLGLSSISFGPDAEAVDAIDVHSVVAGGVWMTNYFGDGELYRVPLRTGDVQLGPFTPAVGTFLLGNGVVRDTTAGRIIAMMFRNATNEVYFTEVDAFTFVPTYHGPFALPTLFLIATYNSPLYLVSGKLWYLDGWLNEVAIDGTGFLSHAGMTDNNTTSFVPDLVNPSIFWLNADSSSSIPGLRKYDVTTDTEIQITGFDVGIGMSQDLDYVYGAYQSVNKVVRVSKFDNSYIVSPALYAGSWLSLAVLVTPVAVYAVIGFGPTPARIVQLDPVTLAIVASEELAQDINATSIMDRDPELIITSYTGAIVVQKSDLSSVFYDASVVTGAASIQAVV